MEIAKTIEGLLSEKEVIETIKKLNAGTDINMASMMIGEVYTYCFACNDGKEITKQEVISYLNDRILDFKKPEPEREEARAETLMKAMAKW